MFQLTPAGALTQLYAFTGGTDGGYPTASLVQGADGNFYGTTSQGGAAGAGTVFQLTSGGGLTVLYTFTGGADGGYPSAGLIRGADGNLYGTASSGGASSAGTVFQLTPAGNITVLYSFTGGTDGGYPIGGVIQATDGNFYGTTYQGGDSGAGVVFQLSNSERQELAAIYVARGLTRELATQVAQQLMAHDALGAHSRDELGVSETVSARPVQAGLTSAATFAVGAALPLLTALVSPVPHLVPVVAATSLVFLVALGALSARTGGAPVLKASLRVAFWGALAMGITAIVGRLFGTVV